MSFTKSPISGGDQMLGPYKAIIRYVADDPLTNSRTVMLECGFAFDLTDQEIRWAKTIWEPYRRRIDSHVTKCVDCKKRMPAEREGWSAGGAFNVKALKKQAETPMTELTGTELDDVLSKAFKHMLDKKQKEATKTPESPALASGKRKLDFKE